MREMAENGRQDRTRAIGGITDHTVLLKERKGGIITDLPTHLPDIALLTEKKSTIDSNLLVPLPSVVPLTLPNTTTDTPTPPLPPGTEAERAADNDPSYKRPPSIQFI